MNIILFQENHSDRLQVLLDVLGVTGDSLSLLPPQLKLPAAVTCYWMQRAKPKPDLSLLNALLLKISTGSMTRPRTGGSCSCVPPPPPPPPLWFVPSKKSL